ncbi:hypothetical protein QVD17_22737 [Tagetes erecta]|uniref:LisH domain-containing protein n=1 Tax=Tagetes erecta TaxID=13708 RepID=A0AAD8NTT5_TARER|nr:hypothetical protein QVD17_22737 [Tagetes erecta]
MASMILKYCLFHILMVSPTCNKSNPPSHCFTTTTATAIAMNYDSSLVRFLDCSLYFSFVERGLYETAEVFRRETGIPFSYIPVGAPLSPTGPFSPDEVPGHNALMSRIYDASRIEAALRDADDASSYTYESNNGLQSGVNPSGDELNGQAAEELTEINGQVAAELTLDEIFADTDNQGQASVVEAYQSSKVVSDEFYVNIEEDDIWDFSVTNDIIELSPPVNGKKNEEGGSCSKDVCLYDSSAFDLGNEDAGAISAFGFKDNHKAPNNDEMQRVTVGGSLVLQTMTQPERLILPSTPASIEDTAAPEPHSVAQTTTQPEKLIFPSPPANIEDTAASEPHSVAPTIANTTEIASNESGRKRKLIEEMKMIM